MTGHVSGTDAPMLIMTSPVNAKYTLADATIIGRDPDSDVIIPDRRVSRAHAEIVRAAGEFVLRDRKSKNGTFVNGERLAGEYRLQDGDEIEIALCCQLIFVGPGATAPLSVENLSEAPVRSMPDPRSLVMDTKAHRVWVGGAEIQPPLSLAQFRLLRLLWSEPGRIYTREEVVREVWPGEDPEGITEQAIDAVVRRLRDRLEAAGAGGVIATVRGHGFRLTIAER